MLKNITSRQIVLGIALAILIWAIGNMILNSSARLYAQAEDRVEIAALEYKRATTAVSMGVADELDSLVRLGHSEIDLTAAKIKFYKLESETESKKYPDYDSEKYEFAKSELKRLSDKIGLHYKPKYRIPTDLFYVFLREEGVYVTQTPRQHFVKNGLIAVDLGTHHQSLQMYAPDFNNQEVEWYAETKEYPQSSGSTIILTNAQFGLKWIVGHSIYDAKDFPKTIRTGEKLAMSSGTGEGQGVTSGEHSHLEFFTRIADKYFAANYTLLNSNKHDQWNFKPDNSLYGSEESVKIYGSSYNAGDPNQNDGSPCIGASGRDICAMLDEGKNPIALTSDIRNILGVEFGDEVVVTCQSDEREFIAQVEDEMNARFRSECITSPNSGSLCIKFDIAFPLGVQAKGCRAIVSKLQAPR